MQKRLLNYKEDDSTFLLNQMLVGIIPAGLYFGFDANLDSTLILKLIQSQSGMTEIDIDLNESICGLIKTKQGVIVKDYDTIELPIEAGDVLPRIDLIICEHAYTEIAGGSQALYSVLKGTPASDPVKPLLTSENEQIEIGSLYVPAGMLLLTDADVVYTKVDQPQFANNTIRISNLISSIANCLQKSQNLNDVVSKSLARTNLDVYSKNEVNTEINNVLSGLSSFLEKTQNLNDLPDKGLSRFNLDVLSVSEVADLINSLISNLAIIGTALGSMQLVLTDSNGHLISEAKKTALNKDFTTAGGDAGGSDDVARGDHFHDGRYYTETEIDTKLLPHYKVGSKQTITETTNGVLDPAGYVIIDRNINAGTSYLVVNYTGNGVSPNFDKLRLHLNTNINEVSIDLTCITVGASANAVVYLYLPNGRFLGNICGSSGGIANTAFYTLKKIATNIFNFYNSTGLLINTFEDL